MDDQFLLTNDAARILERSAPTVRYYERIGRLPAQRTPDGTRLFRKADVLRLAGELASTVTRSGDAAVGV